MGKNEIIKYNEKLKNNKINNNNAIVKDINNINIAYSQIDSKQIDNKYIKE